MTANDGPEPTSADDASRLVELARKHFESRGGISPAEEKLFRGAANGAGAWLLPDLDDRLQEEVTSYRNEEVEARQAAKPAPTPAEELKPFLPAWAHTWAVDRVVRADRIAWLCTDRQAKDLISSQGAQLAGARIEGELVLSHARIPFRLCFNFCSFAETIRLPHAHVSGLSLKGTHSKDIVADGLHVEAGVFHLFHHLGHFENAGDLRIQTVHDRLRCPGRQHQVVPRIDLESGQRLGNRGRGGKWRRGDPAC